MGDRHGQAVSLGSLGAVHQRQGNNAQALACLRELGVTLHALGREQEARAHWRQALAILQRLRTTDADEVRVLLGDRADPSPA